MQICQYLRFLWVSSNEWDIVLAMLSWFMLYHMAETEVA